MPRLDARSRFVSACCVGVATALTWSPRAGKSVSPIRMPRDIRLRPVLACPWRQLPDQGCGKNKTSRCDTAPLFSEDHPGSARFIDITRSVGTLGPDGICLPWARSTAELKSPPASLTVDLGNRASHSRRAPRQGEGCPSPSAPNQRLLPPAQSQALHEPNTDRKPPPRKLGGFPGLPDSSHFFWNSARPLHLVERNPMPLSRRGRP